MAFARQRTGIGNVEICLFKRQEPVEQHMRLGLFSKERSEYFASAPTDNLDKFVVRRFTLDRPVLVLAVIVLGIGVYPLESCFA